MSSCKLSSLISLLQTEKFRFDRFEFSIEISTFNFSNLDFKIQIPGIRGFQLNSLAFEHNIYYLDSVANLLETLDASSAYSHRKEGSDTKIRQRVHSQWFVWLSPR